MNDKGLKLANPAPLGLLGFGMTTVLLCLHFAGIMELTVVIGAMMFALGGTAQLVAGVFELKQGNTFGGTAFTAFGCFWWSLAVIFTNPLELMDESDEISMGFYLALWGVFALFMFFGSRKHNTALQVVFLSITIVFFGLALSEFTGVETFSIISGIIGIFSGGSAIYTSMGTMLKGEYGREILPLDAPKKVEKKEEPEAEIAGGAAEDKVSEAETAEDSTEDKAPEDPAEDKAH